MIKNNVLPADTFVVVNKTILTEQDRKIITMLYQPIIGSISTNLFFTFWSYLDKLELMSTEETHHQLMTNMNMNLEDIIEAREKLEGIGLLKTYVKKGNINSYIYCLYSPLSAYEFFNNPILDVTLLDNIGKEQYEKLVQYFKLPNFKIENYDDITCSFSDVFKSNKISYNEHKDIKKINKNGININEDFDLNYVFDMIPDEVLNKRKITKEMKTIIEKLSFIYNLSEETLIEILFNSINDDHIIDLEKLKANCRKYYSFENKGKVPSIVYNTQPEYLRKEVTDLSDKSRMIHKFETTSPFEILYEKNNYTKPSLTDLKTLEYLLLDQELTPGVVNVLIDYVLRINDNKFSRNFVEAISSQWVRSKIKTVEEAMTLAEKEYKGKRNTTNKTTKTIEKKPSWFGKDIKENLATEEEQLEFERKLKNMK